MLAASSSSPSMFRVMCAFSIVFERGVFASCSSTISVRDGNGFLLFKNHTIFQSASPRATRRRASSRVIHFLQRQRRGTYGSPLRCEKQECTSTSFTTISIFDGFVFGIRPSPLTHNLRNRFLLDVQFPCDVFGRDRLTPGYRCLDEAKNCVVRFRRQCEARRFFSAIAFDATEFELFR